MDIAKVFPTCETCDNAKHTTAEQKACNRYLWMQFGVSYMVYGFLGPTESKVVQQRIALRVEYSKTAMGFDKIWLPGLLAILLQKKEPSEKKII